jgi:uncharacterized protein
VQLHHDGTVVVSPTDLVGFLECDHLTTLELGRIEGHWDKPHEREDPEVKLLQERGEAHEHAYLARLRAEGRTVVELARPEPRTPAGYRAAEAATVQAMRDGAGAIYQAVLFDGRWIGYADFLLRVDRPSPAFGDWSYEVADTKLSRAVKGAAVLQVCVYSDRLGQLQGVAPEHVHVVTGDGATSSLRLVDYAAYYRAVRARFEAEVFGDGGLPRRDVTTIGSYPDPVEHCRVCVWFPVCMDRRRADDHLSLVAGMSRAATAALVASSVSTLAALGRLDPAERVPDLNVRTLERVREQARVQLSGREAGRTEWDPMWELIPPRPEEPGRGLALLPEPSPLDVFFDIEADPWLGEHGLEYLLGVLTVDGAAPAYRPLWGHDASGERAAFEALVDEIVARLDRDPGMHVYHYGGYESGAIKRLMQRYATREDEVDRLLRAGVLVDLYTVVRQGIWASVESYSLKTVEHLFGFDRQGRVTRAGFSVVEYEAWLRDGDPAHLDALAAYNRDDCLATLGLRDWLEERRAEGIARGWDLPRPVLEAGEPPEALAAAQAATAARVERLRAGLPDDPAERDGDAQARWLLASLLDYHRREAKPEWWRWFDLKNKATPEELVEASDAIGGLEHVGDVEQRKRSVVRRYRFPPQDHKFRVGSEPVDPDARDRKGEAAGMVVGLDDTVGTIDILRGPGKLGYHPRALIPASPFGMEVLRDGLGRLADDVIERGMSAGGPYRAARDLLLRLPPRSHPTTGRGSLRWPDETVQQAGVRLVRALDDTVLPVQGPPGTGKTYNGARMILAALDAGLGPVGVTAQSHKTIGNAIEKIEKAAREAGRTIRIVQKCEPHEASGVAGVTVTDKNEVVEDAVGSGSVDVVAGTAWLFARETLAGRIGLLVVDEAGQLALATTLAMSGAARSILLLGDPNQLAQVTQGLHPEGAAASALGHVLGDEATLADDRGLFLDRTWRMHPDVNSYISETFYERRLGTEPSTARQRILAPGPAHGTGIRWIPVRHRRNEQRSREEARVVAEIVDGLIGEPWVDADGVTAPLSIEHLLVVAPYNAQVAIVQEEIERRLGERVRHDRVGTVDKFQGREGAVAIYTMAASSAEDAPRGMDFLYDVHRLNVAVSRARAVAIVVASPELLRVAAKTPEQMRLANALCRYVEVAAEQAAGR